jgi:hypothetical protein
MRSTFFTRRSWQFLAVPILAAAIVSVAFAALLSPDLRSRTLGGEDFSPRALMSHLEGLQPLKQQYSTSVSNLPTRHSERSPRSEESLFSSAIHSLTFTTHAADKNSVFSSDKGKLNILLDGKSVGHEEFSIEPVGTNWTAKGKSSLVTPDGKSTIVTGTLVLQPDGSPVSYDWVSQADKTNSAHVNFVNGVAKTTLQMQGAHPFDQENSFGNPHIVVLDNNLYHQYAVLARVYDWTRRGTQSFPVLIPQELTPGTISVDWAGAVSAEGKSYEGLKVTTADLEVTLFLDSNHKLMRLEVPSAKAAIVRE